MISRKMVSNVVTITATKVITEMITYLILLRHAFFANS